MIRVIIADDHPIVRDALKNLIIDNNMSVVAEAENSSEVLICLDKNKCDLLILDMSMPGNKKGVELIKEIASDRKKSPPILVFSMSNDGKTALAALRAGASGYLTKDSEPGQILEAIQKVVMDGKFVSPAIAEQIMFGQEKEEPGESPNKLLSPREYQIFLMLVDGKSIDAIAEDLFISRQTVGTHKMRLMQKLGLKSNVDIVRYAVKHGLVSY